MKYLTISAVSDLVTTIVAFGNGFWNISLTCSDPSPPIIIRLWFLKSSNELASVKNSGLKHKLILGCFSDNLSVVPGGTVDFITTVLFFAIFKPSKIDAYFGCLR